MKKGEMIKDGTRRKGKIEGRPDKERLRVDGKKW